MIRLQAINQVARRSPLHSFPGAKDISFHPLFRDPVTRWVWRFYTHRLTLAGRWFAWPTLALGIYALCSLYQPTYIPFSYCACAWAGAALLTIFYRPSVRVKVQHAGRTSAGETLPLEVEVQQLGRLAGIGLVVLPQGLPPSINPVPEEGMLMPTLLPGQMAQVRLGLSCAKRGAYRFKGFRVQTDFPFGLLNAYTVIQQEQAVLVYPLFTRLNRFDIPVGRRYQPGGVALASTLGDAFEFIGDREYREGDNIRDIDWRATARLNTLVVREYREEYFHRVAVILDTHIPRQAPESGREDFERAVSLCAAIAEYLSRQDYLVDLFAAGPHLYHLTAGRSLAYLDEILDILACVEESPAAPFELIEPEILENLSRITTIICILLDWDESRQSFVHRLSLQGAGLKLIMVRDTPSTLSPTPGPWGEIQLIDSGEFQRGMEEL